jgi:hypothetical protein
MWFSNLRTTRLIFPPTMRTVGNFFRQRGKYVVAVSANVTGVSIKQDNLAAKPLIDSRRELGAGNKFPGKEKFKLEDPAYFSPTSGENWRVSGS